MATAVTTAMQGINTQTGMSPIAATRGRARVISREAGRGLEMLGHAIDYLSDEFALECLSVESLALRENHPSIQAISLLKRLNREVYYACPERPSWGERLRRLAAL